MRINTRFNSANIVHFEGYKVIREKSQISERKQKKKSKKPRRNFGGILCVCVYICFGGLVSHNPCILVRSAPR
jgi:ribosomal protein L34E